MVSVQCFKGSPSYEFDVLLARHPGFNRHFYPLDAQAIRSDAGCRTSRLDRNNDGSSGVVNIGFTVNLFGKQRSSLYVNNNANLTFDDPLSDYSPDPIRSIRSEMIAAYWADVDTTATLSNVVSYGTITVGYFDAKDDKLSSFQIVLIDRSDTGVGNFDVEFNYERILWETGDASEGVNGFGGISARVGYTNGSGSPDSSFELPGSGIPGAFLDNSPTALVRRSLNTTVPGRLYFPVRNGALRSSITVDSSFLVFRAPGAAPVAPVAQVVNLSSNGGQVQYDIVRVSTANGGNWLSGPNPGTGVTPSALTVRANPNGLARGAYTGEIFVQPVDATIPPITIAVTFLVGDQVPFTVRNGVVNGASYITGVLVPGSIFSIFGENLAPAVEGSTIIPLPVVRAGAAVTLNGTRIPLFLVTPNQINGLVPLDTRLGGALLRIEVNGTISSARDFHLQQHIAGHHAESGFPPEWTSSDTAGRHSGDCLPYGNWFGRQHNRPRRGDTKFALSRALARFTATIGGRPAEVLFAGYSPGSIGLAQVNVLVPSGLTGAQQSVLFANNITSAPVLVYVAP